jgi:hypothetical protein
VLFGGRLAEPSPKDGLAGRYEMFVITCGRGEVIINGLNQPVLFETEEQAWAYIEEFKAKNEGDYRNQYLFAQRCNLKTMATA